MNAPIKIETGIEVPPSAKGSGGGRSSKYPLDDLEVGQSFAIPLTGERLKQNGADRARVRLSVSIAYFQRTTGKKFTTRLLKDEGVVRCWRIA